MSLNPPLIIPEADWEQISLPFEIGSGRNFFPKLAAPSMRMSFFRKKSDRTLIGRVWFGEPVMGPPGFVHGGVSSYVLDEAMGSVTWANHYACVARSFVVDFLEMTPIGEDLWIRAWIEKVEDRNCDVRAEIYRDSGQVLSQSRGQFHRLAKDKVDAFSAGWTDVYDFSQILYPKK